MLEQICSDLIPDNEDKEVVITLLNDACMNARQVDDEELYYAYIKVLEEYVYTRDIAKLRVNMLKYWKDHEQERDRNSTPH